MLIFWLTLAYLSCAAVTWAVLEGCRHQRLLALAWPYVVARVAWEVVR